MLLSYLVVLVFLAGCGRQAKIVEQPFQLDLSPELQSIDSLLQQRPDSALMRLIEFQPADHYRSLLLSEALYKTDNTQQNRDDLLAAMCYFDSLAAQHPDNDDLTLLSARSHYMNGVGYYETDSIVDACREYLHTLEIMEGHFNEEDLIGYKAKFLGLTYTRLGEIMYYNDNPKPAIESYKQALNYYRKVKNYNLANTYRNLGGSFYLHHQNDSAILCYRKAVCIAERSNKVLTYGATLSESAPIYYDLGYIDSAFMMIKQALLLPVNADTRLARYYILGSLYAKNAQYDSAIFYLKQSIKRESYTTQTSSAELLIDCYKAIGDTASMSYYTTVYGNCFTKYREYYDTGSELAKLYGDHIKKALQKEHDLAAKQLHKRKMYTILLIIITFCCLLLFFIRKYRKLSIMKQQMEANTFIDEPICRTILDVVNTNRFKSKISFEAYKEHALSKEQLLSLREAVNMHYNNFTQKLCIKYPKLSYDDIDYCCLYLLGLKDTDVSALMQKSYRAVIDRNNKMTSIFETNDPIQIFLSNMALACQ